MTSCRRFPLSPARSHNFSSILNDVSNPYTLLYKDKTDHAFDYFQEADYEVYPNDRKRCVIRQKTRCRDIYNPYKTTVEEKCNKRLSARSKRKI